MTSTDIRGIFHRFSTLRVGVIGDFALDFYFNLQTQTDEKSLETGRDVFWGSRPSASLGAAGNVVQNLVALGVAAVHVIGCIGNDLFGREMQFLFNQLGVNTQHLHVLTDKWDTCVYTKPNQNGAEANRVDFGTTNHLDEITFLELMTGLEQLLAQLDVLLINQQFANPLLTSQRVAVLNTLIARFPAVRFLADMRDMGNAIQGAILKVNTAELARFLATPLPEEPDQDWCAQQGNAFRQQCGGPLLLTRGQKGIMYLDETGMYQIDGLPLEGELDTVGAGDTVVAMWSACTGVGATSEQALTLANLAAAVTVQKLAQTGTASLSEILATHSTYTAHD